MSVNFKRGFLVLALVLNAVCFQNCAPGFQPLDIESFASSSPSSVGDPSPNNPDMPAPGEEIPDQPRPQPPTVGTPTPTPTPSQTTPDVPPTMSPSPINGYVQARYKELKWGYAANCGLSFNDETYCWGDSLPEANQVYISQYQTKIIPVAGTTIDFGSLRTFEIYTCFNVNPTRDVYCFTMRDAFSSVNGTTVRAREIKLTPDHKRLSGVKEWRVGRAYVFFLDQEGRLSFANLETRGSPMATGSSSRFKYFEIDPVANFTGINTNNVIQTASVIAPEESFSPSIPLSVKPDQILRLGTYSVLSDGRILKAFSTSTASVVSAPEILIDRIGISCFVSATKNVYCFDDYRTKLELKFSIPTAGFKQVVQSMNLCGLKMDGSYYCRNAEGKFLPVYERVN